MRRGGQVDWKTFVAWLLVGAAVYALVGIVMVFLGGKDWLSVLLDSVTLIVALLPVFPLFRFIERKLGSGGKDGDPPQ